MFPPINDHPVLPRERAACLAGATEFSGLAQASSRQEKVVYDTAAALLFRSSARSPWHLLPLPAERKRKSDVRP